MPDVLCLLHRGIRCGMPPRCVLGISPLESYDGSASLWERRERSAGAGAVAEERALYILTKGGPRTIAASSVGLLSISTVKIWAIPPLVRRLLPEPHVVGLAEIEDGLIWLVDPKRFQPSDSEPVSGGGFPDDTVTHSSLRLADRA
jgi:hypothetical protein